MEQKRLQMLVGSFLSNPHSSICLFPNFFIQAEEEKEKERERQREFRRSAERIYKKNLVRKLGIAPWKVFIKLRIEESRAAETYDEIRIMRGAMRIMMSKMKVFEEIMISKAEQLHSFKLASTSLKKWKEVINMCTQATSFI